ncbi:uncharacterized protein LOC123531600 [Mercenaria mercenaria]|uniref:uncharacterized protein LOC123531600 n=1 Tax=Mercenaria mercenaria TaxID=6596 RepID=UPI00234E6211|nr:uncharacterized protein LOC123531600 [Mercenaria mercenaria]
MDPVQENIGNEKALVEQLNDEFKKKVLPVTIFVGIEVVLGFFGNLSVLYVFLFHYPVCNFRYFVLCLAFIDIISTLTTMPGEMVTHLYWYVYPVAEVCKVKSFFNMFTVSAEALCLLTIAIDRYRKVCQPFGWQIKPKGALIVILLIYIVSLILAMPVPFLWGISFHQEVYRGVNITTTICEKDGKYKLTKRPLQYSITMESILIICLIVMFVLYVQLARRILLKKRRRKRWSAKFDVMVTSSSFSTNAHEMKALQDHSEIAYISSIENSRRKLNRQSEQHPFIEGNPVITHKPSEQQLLEGHLVTTPELREQQSLERYQVSNFKPSEQQSSEGHHVTNSKPSLQQSLKGHQVTTFKPNLHHTPKHASVTARQIKLQTVPTDFDTPTDDSRGVTSDVDDAKSYKTTKKPPKSRSKRASRHMRTKVRRKTLIMFVLTLTFMITTVLYLTLLSFIARSDDVIHKMSHTKKAVYFLAFRLYFINHVINPTVYGLLDPHFRKGLQKRR